MFNIVKQCLSVRSFSSASTPLLMRATPVLCSEPIKKKKVDNTVILDRLRKRKKKLQAAIAKALKQNRRLKPILEIEGFHHVDKMIETHKRECKKELTFEEQFAEDKKAEAFLEKWNHYKAKCHVSEFHALSQALSAQKQALAALKEESPQLYRLAVEPDPYMIPFKRQGPSCTPANASYKPPMGEINDLTDKFDRTYCNVEEDPKKKKKHFVTKL